MLNLPQIDALRRTDPLLSESLARLVDAINSVAKQTNTDPTNPVDSPPQLTELSVTAADGIFDIKIIDANATQRGIFYFAEYSANVSFAEPITVFMGPTRNLRIQLGNQTLYWRAYSQYLGSNPSTPIYFGAPTAVVGGGVAGPTQQTSAGTGGGGSGVTSDGGGGGFGERTRTVQF
jgi:hypothetical protein